MNSELIFEMNEDCQRQNRKRIPSVGNQNARGAKANTRDKGKGATPHPGFRTYALD